jgi:hypothetical protein
MDQDNQGILAASLQRRRVQRSTVHARIEDAAFSRRTCWIRSGVDILTVSVKDRRKCVRLPADRTVCRATTGFEKDEDWHGEDESEDVSFHLLWF